MANYDSIFRKHWHQHPIAVRPTWNDLGAYDRKKYGDACTFLSQISEDELFSIAAIHIDVDKHRKEHNYKLARWVLDHYYMRGDPECAEIMVRGPKQKYFEPDRPMGKMLEPYEYDVLNAYADRYPAGPNKEYISYLNQCSEAELAEIVSEHTTPRRDSSFHNYCMDYLLAWITVY